MKRTDATARALKADHAGEPMTHLSEGDLRAWVDAVRRPPTSLEQLPSWLAGPLKSFFPFEGLVLGCGELVARELSVTHLMAVGHKEEYVRQLETTFELERRGSLKWWATSRQPFYVDPNSPPWYTSPFELAEIKQFELRNVAGHGVLNVKGNAGTYFGFSGVKEPLGEWHLDALRLMAPVLNDLLLTNLGLSQAPSDEALAGLTKRQIEIVRLVVAGLNDKVVARELGIAEKTVRNQLVDVYAKLAVHKRTELITLLK